MFKRMFAVVSMAALLGVAVRLQVDPAAHAQSPPPVVTFDWATVGDPGNACDPQGPGRCFGAVGYAYRIAKHEVTNAQYAAFLNAKAASDPLALYNTEMATWSGITRSGNPGSYTYDAVPGRENLPVVNVSYFDALRFANWLHNGQGSGDTETGAYSLLGRTPTRSNPLVQRNAGATIFLPTDEEWYKAAHYDTSLAVFFDYPTATDTLVVCSAPTAVPNRRTAARPPGASPAWGATPAPPARAAPSTREATPRSGPTGRPASSSNGSYAAGTSAAPRTVSEDRSWSTTIHGSRAAGWASVSRASRRAPAAASAATRSARAARTRSPARATVPTCAGRAVLGQRGRAQLPGRLSTDLRRRALHRQRERDHLLERLRLLRGRRL